MQSAFRKISRVTSLLGATKWYLSDDCLLAARRVMYTVEYRRFYLHDLESIVVWPSRGWIWRMIIPGAIFALLDLAFSQWVNLTTGAVFGGIGVFWVTLELILGPTAKASIRTTGASVDLPLVARVRRGHKVLAKIDASVRAARVEITQPGAPVANPAPAPSSAQNVPRDSAVAPIADTTQTNDS